MNLAKFGHTLLATTLGLGLMSAAGAQAFPDKPIRLIVPVAAGGGVDSAFRTLAPFWSETLGQQIVIDNKPGGSQIIGTDLVAKAAADGYTLVAAGVPIAFNTALGRKLPYDPLIDLTPVSEVVTQPLLIAVNPSVPAKNIKELAAWAGAQKAPVPYGSGGPGSYGHLWWEMFRTQQRISGEHVGYPGVAPALRDLIAGQIPLLVDAIVPTGAQVQAGKANAVAIVRATRSPLLPGVPTLAEQGINAGDAAPFYGILGPKGLPEPVLNKLNSTLVQALNKPELRKKMEEMGFDVVGSSPTAYGDRIRREITLWSRIVKENGIKIE